MDTSDPRISKFITDTCAAADEALESGVPMTMVQGQLVILQNALLHEKWHRGECGEEPCGGECPHKNKSN